MPPPCGHTTFPEPGLPWDRERECRLCWLYANDAGRRAQWDAPPPAPKRPGKRWTHDGVELTPGQIAYIEDRLANHGGVLEPHFLVELREVREGKRPTAAQLREAGRSLPPPAKPGGGFGTELAGLLTGLGIVPDPGCPCKALAAEWDARGTAWVRENRDAVAATLRGGAPRWGLAARLKAAALAVGAGLAWKLDPLDPYPGLVGEALRRAEAKGF